MVENKTNTGVIYGINGPIVYIKGRTQFKMSEMVYVGNSRLVGEVISLTKDMTTIQVYEETTEMKPGELVEGTGAPLAVTLGPGIITNIFDGIERPLSEIAKRSGAFIGRGLTVSSLDEEKKWKTKILLRKGDEVSGGTIFAEVQETSAIVHKSMVPPDVSGTILRIVEDGDYTMS